MESGYPSNDGGDHKKERNDGPDNSPAVRRTSIFASKDACIRAVHFAKDEIITLFRNCGEYQMVRVGARKTYNIPDTVKARHNAYEKLDR
jgi:hypothetical protein